MAVQDLSLSNLRFVELWLVMVTGSPGFRLGLKKDSLHPKGKLPADSEELSRLLIAIYLIIYGFYWTFVLAVLEWLNGVPYYYLLRVYVEMDVMICYQ